MPFVVPNLDWLRNAKPDDPQFGQKLSEALSGIAKQGTTIEQQGNFNANGQPQPPPAINSVNVQANDGHFQVSINHDGAQFYRGVSYFLEHSDNPQFTNPHVEELGASRNANLFLGNTTRYIRAYAAYQSSHPGPMVYHGSQSQPIAVNGGGSIPGPNFAPSQGSGTGTPGQAHSGPGPTPFRGPQPPIR